MKTELAEKLISICGSTDKIYGCSDNNTRLTEEQRIQVEAELIKHFEFERIGWMELPSGLTEDKTTPIVVHSVKITNNDPKHTGKIGYIYKVLFTPTIYEPNELYNLCKNDFNIIKSLTKTTRPKPKTTIEFLRLIKIIAKKIFNNIITQTNKTIRINKEVKKYNKICFNEYAFYKALYHIKIFNKNALICPYIKALINNEIFDNIDNKTIEINELLLSDDEKSINSTETEDAKSTTEENNKLYLLPYEKINIDILINDVNK